MEGDYLMRTAVATVCGLLLAGMGGAQQPPATATKTLAPETLRAELKALKPAEHVWRQIHWKTCPLEALNESRQQKKPVITWVFLGTPADERC
jgi:hypothetical protein